MAGIKKVLVMIVTATVVKSTEYYVKPENSSIACPSQPCLTLSEYSQYSTKFFTSNSAFTLLQGLHLLNQTVTLLGVINVSLNGAGTEKTSVVMNEDCGNLICNNSKEVKICSLKILYEGRNEASHTAITAENSELHLHNVQFIGNGGVEKYSQGLRLVQSSATLVNCSFMKWHSLYGGAVYSNNSILTFFSFTNFISNTAEKLGGGVYFENSNITFMGTTLFLKNEINSNEFDRCGGAGLYGMKSSIEFHGLSIFKHNKPSTECLSVSTLFVHQSTLRILKKAILDKNSGGIVFLGEYSNITMKGEMIFSNNSEGGMTLYSCCLICIGKINFFNNGKTYNGYPYTVNIQNSTAKFSGNVVFSKNNQPLLTNISNVLLEGNVTFINNRFIGNGGAISIFDSTLGCSRNCTFMGNFASGKGGALYAFNSIINITGNCSLMRNTAMEGGGMAFEENPAFSFFGRKQSKLKLHAPVEVTFERNVAVSNGGALLFLNSDSLTQCILHLRKHCFILTNFSTSDIHLNFIQNHAKAGTVLYAGSLECCTDLIYSLSSINSSADYLFSSYSVSVDLNHLISSQIIVYAERGKNFTLSVIAWGQEGSPVASTIHAYIMNDNAFDSDLLPQNQWIEDDWQDITFRLNSKFSNNTLVLYPDGPCSREQREVTVILASCPAGFNLTGIYCTCDKNLQLLSDIVKCDRYNIQIYRIGNSWISAVWGNDTTQTYIYHPNCPPGYCKPEGDEALFQNDSDSELCSSNRSGLLCGACKEGLSLTLNRFTCKECPNSYISLLLLFGLMGVVLIVMLLALKMTVAAGTLNGLILYANIVNVNDLVFPTSHFRILTVFVSWLNLDFGFETCFYNGLDFYSYAWLQYIFPFYLWFLVGAIVLISKYSSKIAKLLGSNPVAVLATVMLMSYTKLLQATILILSSTTLMFTNNTEKQVWLYDANIPYLEGKHIVLSAMAFSVICFVLNPFLFLMCCSYRFQAFSGLRGCRWLNKFKPLQDAFYAPYRPKMRFWPGFMLLVRVCLFTITALSNSNSDKLIAISSVFIAIALIPWLGQRVYEKLYNDILEASFILNICLLSIATFYMKCEKHNQTNIMTDLSIAVVLLQFLGIASFHLFLRLRYTAPVNVFLSKSRNCLATMKLLKNSEEIEEVTVPGASKSVVDLRESLLSSAT